MIICLAICMCCVISDIIFISKLLSHKDEPSETKATTASSLAPETDASGNLITLDTTSSSETEQTTESTQVSKTQTVDAATRSANLTALQTKINDYLSKQSGRYSVYYLNLTNNETTGYKESQPMIAASAIKIAYNTYLYEKIDAGEIKFDDKLAYKATGYVDGVQGGDLESGTGTIQNSADGTEYTIKEVSNLSITISDNCATNMIIRRLGGEDAINNSFLKPISATVDYREKQTYNDYTGTQQTGRRRTSAMDLAKYAEHLYTNYKNKPEAYQPLIDDLCHTEYSWGVRAGVPAAFEVAHKVGFRGPSYNDIAIVFGTEDYVLSLMTESGDASRAQSIMAEVSKMVYEYVESNYA